MKFPILTASAVASLLVAVSLIGSAPRSEAAGFTVLKNFPVTDGEVKAVVTDPAHNVVYVGGFFTAVGGQARANLAAVNATTGAVLPWNPGVTGTNAGIQSMLLSGGSLYIAGTCGAIGGVTRTNIGAISAVTDLTSSVALVTAFNPAANDTVVALATDGTNIFAGGFFTNIGGQAYSAVAKLDPATGSAAMGWNPGTGVVFTMAVGGTNLYVGGSFSTFGGQARANLAAVSIAAGAVTNWDPTPDSTINLVQADATRIYVSGNFTTISSQSRGKFVAYKVADDTLDPTFDPAATSPVFTMAFDGGIVYVGGSFTTIDGEARNRLAALDVSTGFATGWNPGANNEINALAVSAGTVFIGGHNTTTIGGVTRTPSFTFAAVTENAVVPPVTPTAPVVKISGKKSLVTTKSALTIKGSASVADGSVAKVAVKVGKSGAKTAKGTSNWSFKAKLKPGKNVVTVTATGTNGLSSKSVKVTVIRQ